MYDQIKIEFINEKLFENFWIIILIINKLKTDFRFVKEAATRILFICIKSSNRT